MAWTWTRRCLAVLTMCALVLALNGTTASAASRRSPSPASCPGTHNHERVLVSVFISYSSANGGTNCAWVQKEVERGEPTYMEVRIYRCAAGNWQGQDRCTVDDWSRVDSGDFEYYAGSVKVTHTAGRCVMVYYHATGLTNGFIPPHHCG